jgi:hypothetical protein
MKKKILFAFILFAGLMACKKEKVETKVINDMVTNAISDTLGAGDFAGQQHSLSGRAILYKDNTGNHILRLENFNMTSAPDADVLLSKTENYNSSNVIKVLDFGTSNYSNSAINIDVAEDINFTEYPYVIVWCTQYSAYFGHAILE